MSHDGGKPVSRWVGERKAVISAFSDFREMGKGLGIFPAEEANKVLGGGKCFTYT